MEDQIREEEGEGMTFSMCDYCPMRRKCSAYACNMLYELNDGIYLDTADFALELTKKRVEEWMKTNELKRIDWKINTR